MPFGAEGNQMVRSTGAVSLQDTGSATYLLLWPEDGIMRKDDIRGVYDGSIFYRKAEEHQRKQQMKAQKREHVASALVTKVKKLL